MGCCKNVLLSKEVWFRKVRLVCLDLENKGKVYMAALARAVPRRSHCFWLSVGKGLRNELQVWREETFTSCVMFFPTIGNILRHVSMS